MSVPTGQEFRSIFEASLDAIMLTKPDGAILAANPAACRLLGRTEGELCSLGRAGVVDPSDTRLAVALQTRDATGKFVGELSFLRPDGQSFPVEVSTSLFTDGDGQPRTTMVFRDVSERNQAEVSLRLSEEKFAKAFHTSPDGITITRISDGCYLEVNEGFTLISGYGADEVLHRTAPELHIWDDPDQRQVFVRQLADRGEVINLEAVFRFKGGVRKTCLVSARHLEISGVPCVLSTTRDISDRKRAEALLAQEKDGLAVTLSSITDGVVSVARDGLVVLANPAAGQLCGWNPTEAVGLPWSQVCRTLHEVTRQWTGDLVAQVLASGGTIDFPAHTCLVTQDGREVLIEGVAAPIRGEAGTTGVVLVFRDLTERQKVAESLQRIQRLESVGQLAGGIAHDFNNMLGGLFGFLELARENLEQGRLERLPHYLDRALSIHGRARGLTQQLLTFAKGGAPVRRIVQLGPLVRQSAGFALSGSDITCRFDIGPGLWSCDCDENQVGQVVDNLVLNAKQAMGPGGVLTVGVSNQTDPPGHPGTFVRISVADSGTGILPENLSRIFDPFFSTKMTGHGLGLATVFSIVRRHDGWVDVEPGVGHGATFHVFLPALAETHEVVQGAVDFVHRGGGPILVLDDDEGLLEVATGWLTSLGYQVTACQTGAEALARYRESRAAGTPFVAALLDLTVPGTIGGATVARTIRAEDPGAVLIAASGYSEDPIFSHPKEFGFSARLAKPYLKQDMVRVLRDVIGRG